MTGKNYGMLFVGIMFILFFIWAFVWAPRRLVTTLTQIDCPGGGLYSKDDGKLYMYWNGEEKKLDLSELGLEVRKREEGE